MRNFLLSIGIVLGISLTAINTLSAQQNSSGTRLKIGLVLAGGGAKGAAHVGVIKVLEEIGVPIDFIAGTSMGAVVGGLYASGMTSAELEVAVKSIDWDDIFDDKPPREHRDFRRKLDDEGFLTRLKLGFKDGEFQFPRGIILGQKLNFTLRTLARRAIGIDDFDKLPIPFRAVAADIETGESVILRSGDLANAMRASMAVSGVFPPVLLGDKLLVDGGLTNNVPIDVARKMGADILIVVNFPLALKKRKDLVSVVSIVSQSLDLLIQQNSQLQLRTLRAEDILIVPDMGEIGAGSFSRMADAIQLGEKAARAAVSKFRHLIDPKQITKFSDKSVTASIDQQFIVDFIRINNKSRLSDELIAARLRLRPGDNLDIEALELDIADIYGLDYFETVEYQVVIEGDRKGVVITASEKTTGLDSFRFGLNLENDFDGDSAYNVSVRFQQEGLNALGGELLLEATAGEDLRATAIFVQPLDPETRYLITPSFDYFARNVSTFQNGSRIAEFRVSSVTGALRFSRQLHNWGAVTIGVDRGYGWSDVNIGTPSSQEDEFNQASFFGNINYDTLDNIRFPNDGIKSSAGVVRSLGALGADDTFTTVRGAATIAKTWNKNTILFSAKTGITSSGTVPTQDLLQLGGLFNLSGYQSNELTGQDFVIGRVVYYKNLGSKPGTFNIPIYLGASLETGNVWNDYSDISIDELIIAGSIFAGLDSPLGPVYLAYGHAEGGHGSVYLFLGRTF